jgi:transposase
MQIRSVGIDLGKTTFHLVALNAAGKVLVRKKFTQKQLITFTANMQTSLVGMEACSGAHFLGRVLRAQGHDVKLIPAQFVKPFVKSNKNDFLDAEAIAEAVDRQNMRFVPIKTDDQLDLQAMHRVRDRLVARRTSVINQLRAFLLERGMVFAKTPLQAEAGDARDLRERRCEPHATHASSRRPAVERVEGSGATDRCDERRGRRDRLFRSSLPTTQADPGYRTSGCDGNRRRDRQRRGFS